MAPIFSCSECREKGIAYCECADGGPRQDGPPTANKGERMSGGSWDYLTFKLDEAADRLENSRSPLRRALGEHMRLVAKAMHDIEWVDSSDMAEGEEKEAIMAVLGDSVAEKQIKHWLEDGQKLLSQLQKLEVDT